MLAHHRPEPIDLDVERGDDRDLTGHDRGIGALQRRWLAQLGCTKDVPQLLGAVLDTAPTGAFESSGDHGRAEPGGLVGLRRLAQQLERVGCVEVLKGQQGRGKVLPQGRAQPGHVTAAVPDQRLVRSRGQLDRLTQVGVLSDRSMVGSVQADHLGQQVRISGIRLRSRGGVPLAVAGHRERVDREDLIAGRDQSSDPGPAVGLDADLHQPSSLLRVAIDPVLRHLRRDQRVQPRDSLQPFRQPSPNQHPPVVIDDLDVVMALCPVISHEQHQHSHPRVCTVQTPSAAWKRQPAI